MLQLRVPSSRHTDSSERPPLGAQVPSPSTRWSCKRLRPTHRAPSRSSWPPWQPGGRNPPRMHSTHSSSTRRCARRPLLRFTFTLEGHWLRPAEGHCLCPSAGVAGPPPIPPLECPCARHTLSMPGRDVLGRPSTAPSSTVTSNSISSPLAPSSSVQKPRSGVPMGVCSTS